MIDLMNSFLDILQVPMILFMVVVAPIWVVLHYRQRDRTVQELGTKDQSKIDELQQLAEKMEERLITLENILDSEHPDWRNKL